MERIQIQSLAHLRELANGMDEPLEVVHLIGGARFTKLVMWLEDAAQWYVDEDGAEGYYTDVQLAYQTEICSAIEQGTLYAEWESKTPVTL